MPFSVSEDKSGILVTTVTEIEPQILYYKRDRSIRGMLNCAMRDEKEVKNSSSVFSQSDCWD